MRIIKKLIVEINIMKEKDNFQIKMEIIITFGKSPIMPNTKLGGHPAEWMRLMIGERHARGQVWKCRFGDKVLHLIFVFYCNKFLIVIIISF